MQRASKNERTEFLEYHSLVWRAATVLDLLLPHAYNLPLVVLKMSEFILDHQEQDEEEEYSLYSDSENEWVDDSKMHLHEQIGYSLRMLGQDKTLFDSLPEGPEIEGLIKLPPFLSAARSSRRLEVNNGYIVPQQTQKVPTFDLLFGNQETSGAECDPKLTLLREPKDTDSLTPKPSPSPSPLYQFKEGKRRYICSECSYSKATKAAVLNHIGEVHLGATPQCCPHCPFKSGNPDVFRQHIKRCKNRLRCPYCAYSATKTYNMKLHIERKHRKV